VELAGFRPRISLAESAIINVHMTQEDQNLLHKFIRPQESREKKRKPDWWAGAFVVSNLVFGVVLASAVLHINTSIQNAHLQTARANDKAQLQIQQYKLATDLLPTLFDEKNRLHQIIAFNILQQSGPPEMRTQWQAVIEGIVTDPNTTAVQKQRAAEALATAVLVFTIGDADDNLRIVDDGKELMSWAQNGSTPNRVLAQPGTHDFQLQLFNQRSYTRGVLGLAAHKPEGWGYRLEVADANGNSLLQLVDGEYHPDENGPRFGREFTAARFKLDVNQRGVSIRDLQTRPSE
jgi:hypothetical protein